MIGAANLLELCRWFERGEGAAGSYREWSTARDVDTEALEYVAREMAITALGSIERQVDAEGVAREQASLDAITAAVVNGFRLGVDAERRRRDAAELPNGTCEVRDGKWWRR